MISALSWASASSIAAGGGDSALNAIGGEDLHYDLGYFDLEERTLHPLDTRALVDFLDAEFLAGQHEGDVDLLAVQAEATAG